MVWTAWLIIDKISALRGIGWKFNPQRKGSKKDIYVDGANHHNDILGVEYNWINIFFFVLAKSVLLYLL